MDLRRNTLPRLLAGLQVGILGGLSIFLWFLLLSYWGFRSPWGLLNLIAASLRNHATWGLAFTYSTWTGLAAHLFVCGSLGMAVGWILPRPLPQVRISLSGFVFGIVLSLMAYELFWQRYVPLLAEYIRPAASLVSHLLFGLSLAQFPKFYHQLVDTQLPDSSTTSSEWVGAGTVSPSGPAEADAEGESSSAAAESPSRGDGEQAGAAAAGSDSQTPSTGGQEAAGEADEPAADATRQTNSASERATAAAADNEMPARGGAAAATDTAASGNIAASADHTTQGEPASLTGVASSPGAVVSGETKTEGDTGTDSNATASGDLHGHRNASAQSAPAAPSNEPTNSS